MKSLSPLFGVLALLLLAGLVYEHFRVSALEIQLAGVLAERDTREQEIKKLSQRLADLQPRPAPVARSAADGGAPAVIRAAGASAAAQPATVPPLPPGVTRTAPAGWHKNGAKPESYVAGVDANETWGGMPSAYVESLTPTVEGGFGGMMQTTSAESYAGKRVRLSGWIKTSEANEGGGHLWMRIDGQERGQMLGFDNMDNRPVKGSTDWQEASVVLDVPAGASSLNYGFFVSGGGKMWVNGQRIEVVGPEVPTTNMIGNRPALPTAPRNLGFSPSK